MVQYRLKSKRVEAIFFSGVGSLIEVINWLAKNYQGSIRGWNFGTDEISVPTPVGYKSAVCGRDWIIFTDEGFYVMDDFEFHNRYEACLAN